MQLSQEKHDTITDRTLYVLLFILEFAYPSVLPDGLRRLWFDRA